MSNKEFGKKENPVENEPIYFQTKDVGFAAYCILFNKKYIKKANKNYYFEGSVDEFKQIKVEYINTRFKDFNSTVVLLLRS